MDGRRTDARAWVYYKLTSCEPDGSGELIINRDLEKKASLMLKSGRGNRVQFIFYFFVL